MNENDIIRFLIENSDCNGVIISKDTPGFPTSRNNPSALINRRPKARKPLPFESFLRVIDSLDYELVIRRKLRNNGRFPFDYEEDDDS